MILSGSSWPWKFNPQKYNWSPKTRKLLKNKFLGSKWSVILMRVKQSEVYDKVLVTEFCVFLTRRGTVTSRHVSRLTIGYLWEEYEIF